MGLPGGVHAGAGAHTIRQGFFRQARQQIAQEANGTVDPPAGLDWICVSPKAGTGLRVRAGHERQAWLCAGSERGGSKVARCDDVDKLE